MVVRANQTFAEWTGHPREMLLAGTRFVSLLTLGSQLFFETRCVPPILAGEDVAQVALDLRRADGSTLAVLFAATAHARDVNGAPTVVRVTLVDVSQRRAFEERLVAVNDELTRSNEEYDTFTHAAAHDLREPLRGIRQNLEFFLEDTGELPPATAGQIDTALRLTSRMTGMLDDLLAYAQVGRVGWQPEPVDLQTVVGEVLELLGERAAGADLAVGNGAFTADPGALRQILLNLIRNAVKYSSEPAVVEIGTCSLEEAAGRSVPPPTLRGASPGAAVLTVRDRGIGIDPSHHERIFGLFRQLDPAAEGSGTGLALCRLIARRHGGDIWVASAPGEGSTFHVVLSPRAGT